MGPVFHQVSSKDPRNGVQERLEIVGSTFRDLVSGPEKYSLSGQSILHGIETRQTEEDFLFDNFVERKNVDWESVKKVDKESEGNGIWFLLLTMALGNQPGQSQKPDEKTTQNLVVLIKENQDKIKTLVKQDNWEELVKLLNTKSQEMNVKVDWTKVFDDKKTLHDLREVTKIWAEKPKGKSIDVMTIIEEVTKKTGTPRPTPGGERPRPTPGGEHPRPTPGGEHPRPTPRGDHPRPTLGGERPRPTPGGDHPRPTPRGDHPRPKQPEEAPEKIK